MAEKSLWDFIEEGDSLARASQRAEMDRVRRATIKKLRSTSQAALLLKVARRLRDSGQIEFTLNDLSVACFHHDPHSFGMKGYPQYPDNHRIHYILYGTRGLIHLGLLDRVKEGVFQLHEDYERKMADLVESEE